MTMTMTAAAKDELSRVDKVKPCCRRAELATLLRFAGGPHLTAGQLIVVVQLDSAAVAKRLRTAIGDVYGYPCDVRVLAVGGGVRINTRYRLQVGQKGAALARRSGLVDPRGRAVRGLPAPVVAGGVCDAEEVWRGAFLAHGSPSEPGKTAAPQVGCPGPEAAMALTGVARRLGMTTTTQEVRGVTRVTLREAADIGTLLTRIGAPHTRRSWEQRRARRKTRCDTERVATFDDANQRRAESAAILALARTNRAVHILGGNVPDHLAAVGALRTEHPHACLEELERRADPPLTKDAVAGRLRRLLALADRIADETVVPDTTAAITAALAGRGLSKW